MRRGYVETGGVLRAGVELTIAEPRAVATPF